VNLQQQFTLTPRDSHGVDIRGVRIEPGNVDVRVNIAQQEVTLALTIVPQFQGVVADGYNLISIVTDPPAMAITGPLEQLQALTSVTTEPIDINGLRADLTRAVRLRMPGGLQATRDSVSVRLRIVPQQGEIAFSVAPQVTGAGEGLRATLQTSSITVRLRGDLPTLRSLSSSSVRATVSASSLEEGVHVLSPTISVPDGIQVASADPQQVVVALRR
jgi:YbbR domain-containing protein